MSSGKRALLLAVAACLSVSALLAIGILLVGHFGETEVRILATTALLAGYGLLTLPATILLDQGRVSGRQDGRCLPRLRLVLSPFCHLSNGLS